MSVTDTLTERSQRYGDFKSHAAITQMLKDVATFACGLRNSKNLPPLQSLHLEALDMIFHKIGRILNGDASYVDSWHAIAGYAVLVEEALTTPIEPSNSTPQEESAMSLWEQEELQTLNAEFEGKVPEILN